MMILPFLEIPLCNINIQTQIFLSLHHPYIHYMIYRCSLPTSYLDLLPRDDSITAVASLVHHNISVSNFIHRSFNGNSRWKID